MSHPETGGGGGGGPASVSAPPKSQTLKRSVQQVFDGIYPPDFISSFHSIRHLNLVPSFSNY